MTAIKTSDICDTLTNLIEREPMRTRRKHLLVARAYLEANADEMDEVMKATEWTELEYALGGSYTPPEEPYRYSTGDPRD